MDARDDIDGALAEVLRMAGQDPKSRAPKRPRRSPRSWRVWLAAGALFLALPFVFLLRGSTALYLEWGYPLWVCIGLAAVGSGLLLFAGLWAFLRRFGVSLPRFTARYTVFAAVAFAVFAVVYVSADNIKSAAVKDSYLSLHPLLRMSVATLVLVDEESMVTDAGRSLEDYARMGLPANQRSLHFEQRTGYVHAVDLRTIGRSEVRNTLTAWYFRALGFSTLRHVGTADHLHVSLPVPEAG